MKVGNRKFFIAIASLVLGMLAMFHPKISEIAIPFYACLGIIATGFFTANSFEHKFEKGKG